MNRYTFSAVISLFAGVLAQAQVPTSASIFKYPEGPNFCRSLLGYVAPVICDAPAEWPLGGFRPNRGHTYKDPNFGGLTTFITDPSLFSFHSYSSPSSLSRKGTFALIFQQTASGAAAMIVSPRTGLVHRSAPREHGLWSAADAAWDKIAEDRLFIMPSQWDGAAGELRATSIQSYYVSAGYAVPHIDYSGRFHKIVTGGAGDVTGDNWWAFYAPREHLVCAVDLTRKRTFCGDYMQVHPKNRVPYTDIDFVAVTKVDSESGKRYVLMVANPASALFTVNEGTGALDFVLRGPELAPGQWGASGNGDGYCDPGEECYRTGHSDVSEDPSGRQLWITRTGNGSALTANISSLHFAKGPRMAVVEQSGGGRRDLFTTARSGDDWGDHHIGCARNSPYCVISIEHYPGLPRTGKQAYNGEIMVFKNTGEEIRRLAMHRSYITQSGYFDQPRPAISSDGELVMWDTNLGLVGRSVVATAPTNLCAAGFYTQGTWAPSVSGTYDIGVTTASGCPWRVQSWSPWISVLGENGTGPGTVRITVGANTSGSARFGVIGLGQSFYQISQTGR